MKRIFWLLILVVLLPITSFAQQDKEKIEAAITTFFDGISEIDGAKMKNQATADFILLEDGKIWNLDTLITNISIRKNTNIKRVNQFNFIRTEQSGKVAWVSYYNTAEFSLNEKRQTVKWLESAVLAKENGTWKLKLLHSTKLK